jgi:alpha-galactosidase
MRAAVLFFGLTMIDVGVCQLCLAAAAQAQNGIEGRWMAEQAAAEPASAKEVTLSFERRGTALAGSMRTGADEMPLFDVRETGTNVSFTAVIPGTPYVSIRYSGARTGDEIRFVGSDEKHVVYTLTAHRVAPAAAPSPAPPAAPAATPPVIAAAPPVASRAAAAPPPQDTPALRPSQTAPQVASLAPPAQAPQPSATQPPSAATAPTPPLPPAPRQAIANATATGRLNGNWSAEQASPGSSAPIQASLVFTGNRGTMHVGADDWPLFDVRDAGAEIAFSLVIPGTPYITIHYGGTIAGDELQLTSLDEGQGVFRMMAHRAVALPPEPRVALANPPPPPARAAPQPPASPPAAARAPAAPPVQPTVPANPNLALLNPPPPAANPPQAPTPVPRVEPAPPPAPAPPVARAAPSGPPVKLPLPALRDLPPNNLAKTPLMGWASRGKLGLDIDDDTIRQAAESLDETGLRVAGYGYVEVDEGWQGFRDVNGVLHAGAKFPDMKALVDYVHSKGLKFGLQISAAPKSCGGFEGSYGHEAEDAKLFASWGVDYIVADWCGAEALYPTQAEQQAAYQKIAEALRASGRDIVFGISQGGAFDVASWGAKAGANLWRTGPDIKDNWDSVTQAGFALNGKEAFTGPGRINDPGLIQVGNGGMTPDEYRTQLNLWAVLAAPMMLGNEVRIMTKDTLALLTNPEVIAIDQDPSARQAKRVAQNGETEVWARTLADGSIAIGFFNRGSQSAPVAVSWEQLGITGPWRARDLWWHQNIGNANGRYVVFLTGHTSLLLRLSK